MPGLFKAAQVKAYFVLGEFGVATASHDGQVVGLTEHLDDSDACIEV